MKNGGIGMKKMIAFLIITMMILSLIACGSKEVVSDTDVDVSNQTEETFEENEKIDTAVIIEMALEEAEEFEAFSIEAVEYYLKKAAGIELSALEPDWEWKLKNDYCAYGDEPDSGYGHAVIKFTKAEGEMTDEEYQTWLQKVFNATAAASDDSYNIIGYEFAGEYEDALAETTLEESLGGWLQGWGFRVDGKLFVVYVSQEYDKEKESELDRIFYYDSAQIDVGAGLQKSWDDTMSEAEEYMEEHEDEIREALEEYTQ